VHASGRVWPFAREKEKEKARGRGNQGPHIAVAGARGIMDEEEIDGVKSPIKRLGSTRKLLVFNSKLSFNTSFFSFFFATLLYLYTY